LWGVREARRAETAVQLVTVDSKPPPHQAEERCKFSQRGQGQSTRRQTVVPHSTSPDPRDGWKGATFWILLELRMMEVVVTTGAIRRAKLQSK